MLCYIIELIFEESSIQDYLDSFFIIANYV